VQLPIPWHASAPPLVPSSLQATHRLAVLLCWVLCAQLHQLIAATLPGAFCILVGCKADMISGRVVEIREAEQFAGKHHILFMETSALTGLNVQITATILRLRANPNVPAAAPTSSAGGAAATNPTSSSAPVMQAATSSATPFSLATRLVPSTPFSLSTHLVPSTPSLATTAASASFPHPVVHTARTSTTAPQPFASFDAPPPTPARTPAPTPTPAPSPALLNAPRATGSLPPPTPMPTPIPTPGAPLAPDNAAQQESRMTVSDLASQAPPAAAVAGAAGAAGAVAAAVSPSSFPLSLSPVSLSYRSIADILGRHTATAPAGAAAQQQQQQQQQQQHTSPYGAPGALLDAPAVGGTPEAVQLLAKELLDLSSTNGDAAQVQQRDPEEQQPEHGPHAVGTGAHAGWNTPSSLQHQLQPPPPPPPPPVPVPASSFAPSPYTPASLGLASSSSLSAGLLAQTRPSDALSSASLAPDTMLPPPQSVGMRSVVAWHHVSFVRLSVRPLSRVLC